MICLVLVMLWITTWIKIELCLLYYLTLLHRHCVNWSKITSGSEVILMDMGKWIGTKLQQRAKCVYPDSKVHGANMGPMWGRQDPGEPHAVPMNFAIWVYFFGCPYFKFVTCDQHSGYWWPGALAPGHQKLQCSVSTVLMNTHTCIYNVFNI